MENKLKVPHNCYLILTSKCNMMCKHCYGDYGRKLPNRELTGAQWEMIIKQLSQNRIFFVNISGGEPTVHPDFEFIIKSLVENNIYFQLTTNGLFSEKVLNQIIKSKKYIMNIQISLDGCDEDSFNYLRRDRNGRTNSSFFSIVKNNIEMLISNGLPVTIATCLHKQNYKKMSDFCDYILSISPIEWSISTISISGRARNHDIFISETMVSDTTWTYIKTECLKQKIKVTFVDMPSLIVNNKGDLVYYQCPAANWFCEINSDGQVSPCPLARTSISNSNLIFDNILNKNIIEIWNGDAFETFRQMQKSGCEGCISKSKCSRCPPQSIQWFNDPLKPTPYCIRHGEKLHLKNLSNLVEELDNAMKLTKHEDYI